MAKLKSSTSLLLLVTFIMVSVAMITSASPPLPVLPASWSALSQTNSMSTMLYVNNPTNTLRYDGRDFIYLVQFDKGLTYIITAESKENSSISCVTSTVSKAKGPLFDFSNANYVSTRFFNGTSQDLWTGVIVKLVAGVVVLYWTRYKPPFLNSLQVFTKSTPMLTRSLPSLTCFASLMTTNCGL